MKRITVLLLLILSSVTLCAQSKSVALTALEAEISTLKKYEGLKHAAWSVFVYNISESKTMAEYNSQMSLLPASIQKTITTATALALLGSQFRFETALEYSGNIDSLSGTLHGNLYLKGGGDPTLGSARFGKQCNADSVLNRFVRALLNAGIRHIDGALVADESVFDPLIPRSWAWEDVGNYYACAVSGLSINENMYRLYFDAGTAIGDPATFTGMETEIPDMKWVNLVTTGKSGSGDQVYILGGPYTADRILTGTVPLGKKHFDVDGAIPDPARYCGDLFLRKLIAAGINCKNGLLLSREENWKGAAGLQDTLKRQNLATHYSPDLSEIVYYTNLKSVNLYAEAMLKMTGLKQGGYGSTVKGTEAIEAYWVSRGIDWKGMELYDGSGLSRKNRITASALGRILAQFASHKEYSVFAASFPVAGKSGNMSSLLKGTVAENNLIAKTGTMDGVRSFAGYVKSLGGDDLCFVIIMNQFTCTPSEIRSQCASLMQKIAELD